MIKAGFFMPGVGAQVIAAQLTEWDVRYIIASDSTTERILLHHFPNIPIYNEEVPIVNVDLVSGSTPHPTVVKTRQRESNDRDSLDLALFCIDLAAKHGARWLVWECTPRALSALDGGFFWQVLKALEKHGYGFAWRTLDSKFFGVPQSKRYLFVVGYIGDWRPPAAVLFDPLPSTDAAVKYRGKPSIIRGLEKISNAADFILYTPGGETRASSEIPALAAGGPFIPYGESRNFLTVVSPRINAIRQVTPAEYGKSLGFAEDYLKNISGQVQPFGDRVCYGLYSRSSCVPMHYWLYQRVQRTQELLNELGVS